ASKTCSQVVVPASSPVCATSPTTVIDRLGQRRISSRQAIGDSSCASSTITCPKTQVRSAAARSAAGGGWGPPGGGGAGVEHLVPLDEGARVHHVDRGEDLLLLVLEVQRPGALDDLQD